MNSGEQVMILLLPGSSEPAVILTTHLEEPENWPDPTPGGLGH